MANDVRVGARTFKIDKMTQSIDTPVGGVSGPLRVVPEDTTTGCETTDFAGQDFAGSVALIRRGGCTFEQKGTERRWEPALSRRSSPTTATGSFNNVA